MWLFSRTLFLFSVISAPVAVIAGHQTTGDEQDQVHEPPDSQTSQGEQLPDGGAGVAQAETIHPETTQEEGVQQSSDEVVSSVPKNQRGTLCVSYCFLLRSLI